MRSYFFPRVTEQENDAADVDESQVDEEPNEEIEEPSEVIENEERQLDLELAADGVFTYYAEESVDILFEIIERDYKDAMSYVRELFKYFRKSPLKMSELQKLIKSNHGQNLALLLDVKTRWNSVLPMIRRYLKIKNEIRLALEIFNDGQLHMIRHDDALQELSDALEPVEVAVTTLSTTRISSLPKLP